MKEFIITIFGAMFMLGALLAIISSYIVVWTISPDDGVAVRLLATGLLSAAYSLLIVRFLDL